MSGLKRAALGVKYPGMSIVEAAAQEVLLLEAHVAERLQGEQQQEDKSKGDMQERDQQEEGEQYEIEEQQSKEEQQRHTGRCIKAVQQYSFAGMAVPQQVANGDRWLLLNKGLLMRGVGVEDMSKIPCHVLLLPLREAVYARMGLESVMEFMCLPEGGEWGPEWGAEGREVIVVGGENPQLQHHQQQQVTVQLPGILPRACNQLAELVCEILRGLDPAGEQFSSHHEQLLLLQVQQRAAVVRVMREQGVRVKALQLDDVHAANLYLQAYLMLQVGMEGWHIVSGDRRGGGL